LEKEISFWVPPLGPLSIVYPCFLLTWGRVPCGEYLGYYIRDVDKLQISNGNVVRVNIYHLLHGSSCLDLFLLRMLTSHLHPIVYNFTYKDHYIFKGNIINNCTFSFVEYIWHILETNVTLQKVGFKSYLHLEFSV
jgi:hypothetical protein